MKTINVNKFGGPDVLEIVEKSSPITKDNEVLVQVTSIGLNHADLMGRRGDYKLSTGQPPFVPGLEAGGIIKAVGKNVKDRKIGDRVILHPGATRKLPESSMNGTYRTEIAVDSNYAIQAPDILPDNQLGAIWLTYLTAWGCLIWKENLQPGKYVAIPAASSGVGMAASQIVKQAGGSCIGLTTSESKKKQLQSLPESKFDHIVVTHNADGTMKRWHRDLQTITNGHGVDVFFDPVASGEYLNLEIRSLAQRGTIWIYGLLGDPGTVDVTPLIRKYASIKGWLLNELLEDKSAVTLGIETVLKGFSEGNFKQYIGESFPFDLIREAHIAMDEGKHIGKLVLIP